ncbi:YcaO-like family protein [Acinetobacter colistiniresistens]|uniref:YcaO-like family protein n=1 Tax=Acinetobacter colistiniresistens TaxID=280145 RepID=UPI00211CAFC9|nr:YcaO-like family protein [Acinetobacter colistiniresistens]UUM26855.1 YcaO-like family protein [Acinetobacter colistiniresistens]
MYQMTSSLRIKDLDETLEIAVNIGEKVGVSRVTNITWLDKIGIPVFSSIRPNAVKGSLCVNAGKGRFPKEAMVGAYMEAIEFSYAEYRNRIIPTIDLKIKEIIEQANCKFNFLDLNPILGIELMEDNLVTCVLAQDIVTKEEIYIPAELVYHPFLENKNKRILGTSTNGLCSGNSLDEATLHGLAELFERDIQAFDSFANQSQFVEFDEKHENIIDLKQKIEKAGFELSCRYVDNIYQLPYFHAYILDPSDESPVAVSYGSAFHPIKNIAAVRAISEAAQSRLTQIHGGRDDVIDRTNFFAVNGGKAFEQQSVNIVRKLVTSKVKLIHYSKIPDKSDEIRSIGDGIYLLIEKLKSVGIDQVLRVELTPKNSQLTVVKVIVPKMEYFRPELKRVGNRLMKFIKEQKNEKSD